MRDSDQHNFNVLFVETIKKFEVIYNDKLKNYYCKEDQENAWSEVARIVDDTVPSCKSRWRNLRACLGRHLRSFVPDRSYGGTMTKKPYYLFKHMEFIAPFIKIRRLPKGKLSSPLGPSETDFIKEELEAYWEYEDNSQGLKVDIEAESGGNGEVTEGSSQEVEPAASSANEMDINNFNRDPRDACQANQNNLDPLESCAVEYSPPKRPRRDLESEDSDLLFLKSLLPDMRKMNDRQRNRFKRMILGAVDEILYDST